MDAGVAALLGALVGGGTTFAANLVQTKVASRHNRARTAADLAIKEHELDVLLHKEGQKLKESLIAEYVAFHSALLANLEHGVDNTPDVVEALAKKYGVNA
jgi:hypothetical protein